MLVRYALSFLLAACLLLMGSGLDAQEKKMPGVDVLRDIMPKAGVGKPIDEPQMVWAYVAGIGGFILVFALAWFMVRLLALLTIAACFLGGIYLICWAVHERFISTWEQLAFIVVILGAQAGIVSVTANLFLLKGGVVENSPEQPSKDSLSAQGK